MKKFLFTFSILLAVSLLSAQIINEKSVTYSTANQILDETGKRTIPSTVLKFEGKSLSKIENTYVLKIDLEKGFTCFAIGWKSSDTKISPNDFKIEFKVPYKDSDTDWGVTHTEAGEYHPKDTETDYYWSDLMFSYDESARRKLFVTITAPKGVSIEAVKIDFMDLSDDIDPSHAKNMFANNSKSCPEQPALITRDAWCGTYTACTTASYTPTRITATHTVIHHGASPDTYTDGYAVVRSYWNYHVNTLGWADIGYNYLIDKYGNLFQGRKNTTAPQTDVKGSHAGNSNGTSIGINFLGNADVTLPTTEQYNKLYTLLAWWYNNKGFDPTSSASITLQSGGTGTVPRICGHRDVNIGGTACPGTTLYAKLPEIRTAVKAAIDGCGTVIAPPTTSVANPGWKTTAFTANFTDTEASDKLRYRFYQVSDYNGTEWRSNPTFGFFNDNFAGTTIHTDWTNAGGTWAVSNNTLLQSDETNSNSNLYASVNQSVGNVYLYKWKMKISGTGTNKRAGLHFFSDNASLSNRGNSYMVYFRADGNLAQIYEYLDNTMYMRAEFPCIVTPGTLYDYKVILNTSTGEINVFQNDILKGSWTDTTPLTVGNQISLRTGECAAVYDDIAIYKSRTTTTANVTVGNGTTYEIRYQSSTASSAAGKISSIIINKSNVLSNEASANVNIDFWGPYGVSTVNDGTAADIDAQGNLTQISANWTSTTDVNNTISSYYYAVGTTAGGTNIVTWTSAGTALSVTKTGLALTNGTTYYVSVKARNSAGLYSVVKTSDGILVSVTTPVASVSISPSNSELYLGQTATLTATVLPENATNKAVTWQSSNPAVATVSTNGEVFALAVGTSSITATSTDGNIVSNACTVTVLDVPQPELIFTETIGTVAATTIIANHETANGFDNDQFTMSGTGDIRITSVSNGYAGASGSANVYLTTTIGKYFLIEGINTASYTDLKLNFGVYTNAVGYAPVVEVSADGTNYIPLTISNSTGAVWAYKTATGTIPSSSNLRIRFTQPTSTCQIRIDDISLIGTKSTQTVAATGVAITPSNLNLNVGTTATLSATVSPLNATNQSVTWVSSAPSIASVSASGVVTAQAAGSATITAVTVSGGFVSNTCAVIVTATSGEITIFNEKIGTVSAATRIATHENANGFDNDRYTMTGTGDIRTTSASGGYVGASGLANVYLTTAVGKYFQIEGINTMGYSDLALSFGMYTNVIGNAVVVEVSADGINYNSLIVSISTSSWSLKTAAGTIPNASNLRIRFTQPGTTCQFRIDDITLKGTIVSKLSLTPNCSENADKIQIEEQEHSSSKFSNKLTVFPNPASETVTVNLDSETETSEIQIIDTYGKQIYQNSRYKFGNPIEISDLPSGIYIIRINDGKTGCVQKFVKR